MNRPEYLIVHHIGGTNTSPLADSSNLTFEQLNELHKTRFNFISSLGYYVGYHYYITKDGTVKQARADIDDGAHTINYNSRSLGICLAGNFDATLPTEAQIKSLKILLQAKSAQYNIPLSKVVPHRTFAVKTCYGNRLSDSWARDLIKPVVLFKVSAIGLTDGVEQLIKFCHDKVSSFSGGQLGVELVNKVTFPIKADDKLVLSDEQTIAAISKANLNPASQQLIVVMHDENLLRPWYSTNYMAGTIQVPIMKAPIPVSGNTLLFEIGHALIGYYNVNRDKITQPAISNIDNYSGGEQVVIDKIKALMPYLSVFKKMPSVEAKEDMRLIKMKGGGNIPTTKDNTVWLVNDITMTRLWVLDPATRDGLGLPVVEGDPMKYKYGGAIGRFVPDDPLK